MLAENIFILEPWVQKSTSFIIITATDSKADIIMFSLWGEVGGNKGESPIVISELPWQLPSKLRLYLDHWKAEGFQVYYTVSDVHGLFTRRVWLPRLCVGIQRWGNGTNKAVWRAWLENLHSLQLYPYRFQEQRKTPGKGI